MAPARSTRRRRRAEAAPATSSVPEGATPIKGPAARLAQNMVASLGVPTATSFREIDVAMLEARRRELNQQIAPRKVSFTHLIGWAIVRAVAEQRSMSHYFTEIDGQAYRVDPGSVNLGLAVDVERKDGSRFLVVPVIKGADAMDFAAFHARYEELVEKARGNKLSPDDFVGATITLTNPGTLGTTASVPRLMPNQGTIVATGTIRDVGGDRRMTITSTYDHRIIQGAESGAFLRRIEALLSGADGFYADLFAALGARAADVTTVSRCRRRGEAAGAPAVSARPRASGTSSSRPWPPGWRWSRPTGTSDTGPPGSIRSAPSRRRPGPRPGAPRPRRAANMRHRPGRADAHLRSRRHAGRRAPPPARDVQRHDRLRGGAHRLPRGARLAAARHRVRRASAADGGRGPGRAARAAHQRREARALPAQGLPRARSGSASRASTRWCRCWT